MAEPYDPARDLATLLHAALRQGFWQPAARGAIGRLRRELEIADHCLASDIERALRLRLNAARGRREALENVAFLASLPPEVLREALLVWQYERPTQYARLRALLTGQAQPRHLEDSPST